MCAVLLKHSNGHLNDKIRPLPQLDFLIPTPFAYYVIGNHGLNKIIQSKANLEVNYFLKGSD